MLPKLNVPTFDVFLPITKQTVRFRPWLVGDKKVLLIALQSHDEARVRDAIFDVIKRCVLDKTIDILKLPATDVSVLLINLRMRSDSDVVETEFEIKQCGKGNGMGCTRPIRIDLTQMQIVEHPENQPVVKLTDSIGMKLRMPNLEQAQSYLALRDLEAQPEKMIESYFAILTSCIEYIYSGDEIYKAHEVPPAELHEFISQLSDQQFALVEKFFNTLPNIKLDVKHQCRECGKKIEYTFKGIDDFFALFSSMTPLPITTT